MKQKIVIEVPMYREKCRSIAMQAAVAMDGVSSVSIKSETNELVLIGEGVDLVRLTASLRKKFDFVKILIVEEVIPQPPPTPAAEAKEAPEDQAEVGIQWPPCNARSYQYPQNCICHCVSADSNNCSIM